MYEAAALLSNITQLLFLAIDFYQIAVYYVFGVLREANCVYRILSVQSLQAEKSSQRNLGTSVLGEC